jgi:hypothetical protein
MFIHTCPNGVTFVTSNALSDFDLKEINADNGDVVSSEASTKECFSLIAKINGKPRKGTDVREEQAKEAVN